LIPLQTKVKREGFSLSLYSQQKRAPSRLIPPRLFQGTIRLAAAADISRIYELEQICFQYDQMTKQNIRHLIRSPQSSFWLWLGEDDQLLGYIIVLYHKRRCFARIYSVAVHPQSRGMGLGSQMVSWVENEVQERGLAEVRLEVKPDNSAALKVYLKQGYKVVARKEAYYTDGTDAVVCLKTLSAPPRASWTRKEGTQARVPARTESAISV
jgi:ribosomal protein S18 acetylase RimI-like enzyme